MTEERDREERIALDVLHAIQTGIHTTAKSKGWLQDLDGLQHALRQGSTAFVMDTERLRLMALMEKLMLVVSELGEGVEGLRSKLMDDKLSSYSSLEVELADVMIRIFDLAEYFQLRVSEAMIDKMKYNKSRAFKHGGKAA